MWCCVSVCFYFLMHPVFSLFPLLFSLLGLNFIEVIRHGDTRWGAVALLASYTSLLINLHITPIHIFPLDAFFHFNAARLRTNAWT